MSDLIRITTEGENPITTALETVLQVRGLTTIRVELREVHISADYATDATKTIFVQVGNQSTDGTATGTTEASADPNDPATILTGFRNFTVEPTPGTVHAGGEINANTGEFARYWAEGDGPKLDRATTSRLAVWVTSDVACNVHGEMAFSIIAA